MNDGEIQLASDLIGLATQAYFTELTDAERRVLRAVRTENLPSVARPLIQMIKTTTRAQTRNGLENAAFAPALFAGSALIPRPELSSTKGIQVFGGVITEALDLSYVAIPFPLTFSYCRTTRALMACLHIE